LGIKNPACGLHLSDLGEIGAVHRRPQQKVGEICRLVRKRKSLLLAMRGAFECRTGLRTTSREVKQWAVEEVESYLDDPAEGLGITFCSNR
jgi:hypothetical protein